jgi:hypothetical protein
MPPLETDEAALSGATECSASFERPLEFEHIEVLGEQEIRKRPGADEIGFWIEAATFCLVQRRTVVCRDFREPFYIRVMDIINAIHPVKPTRSDARREPSEVASGDSRVVDAVTALINYQYELLDRIFEMETRLAVLGQPRDRYRPDVWFNPELAQAFGVHRPPVQAAGKGLNHD